MKAKERKSPKSWDSDLARMKAHVIKPGEYEEIPELTDEMLARAVVHRGGRPVSENPKKPISLRIPPETLARWKASGPGWQTRMVDLLSRRAPKAA